MPEARRPALGLFESLILLATVVVLLATAGALLQARFGFLGLAATEVLVVAAPALLVTWLARVGLGGLGLRRPRAGALAAALFVGAGGFYLVSAGLEPLMDHLLPVPPDIKEQLRALIGARPLAVEIGVLALAPAVCEELLFRGALFESWRRAGPVAVVLASGLAFGAFHLSLYKLVPTAALGMLAATVALRSRSVLPAMVFHATNNLLVVALVRAGHDDPPPIASPLGLLLAAASVAAIVFGLWATSGPREVAATPP